MRRLLVMHVVLMTFLITVTTPLFAETSQSGVGIVIGRVEVRLERKGGSFSTLLDGIEVDIIRERTVGGEVYPENFVATTSETGVFVIPLDSMEGTFRIGRLKLSASNEWISITRLSVEGDVLWRGSAYFNRFGEVVALNPLILEKSFDGQQRFIMVVEPFADICLDFLRAFPATPWKSAVEGARDMNMKVEREVEPAGLHEDQPEESPATKVPVKSLLLEEEAPERDRGIATIVVTSIVLVLLAIIVGVVGRRKHQPEEREIDVAELEHIKEEREKQFEDEGEAKEEEDPTAVLSGEKDWFLREFRRARVRIHWKKYDSAAVSLEKTTCFMEKYIDRLREKKELYTLVLHYSYLGRCYLEAGRYNDALRAFKRGVELNEYNSRMCEIGFADTLDAIARAEQSPTSENLSTKYPLLSGKEIQSILARCGVTDA